MSTPRDYRLKLGEKEYSPIVIGGMGVNVSTSDMVLAAVKCGCIAHLSDAVVTAVCDRNIGTNFTKRKVENYNRLQNESFEEGRVPKFAPGEYREAQLQYVRNTVEKKQGDGGVFVNCMEKLQIASSQEILGVRLNGILDAGADGVTLSAGLHGHSMRLMSENPRFRDAKIGIVVSSWRALKIFLRTAKKYNRMPDYIILEGPLAGGHLGFGDDWAAHDLRTIFMEMRQNLELENLQIPVITAGGIFDSKDALSFLEAGAAGVQVATRFTVAKESGFSDQTKQAYFEAEDDDVLVSGVSPTGYLFRLLRRSPCLNSNLVPQCVPLGYILDSKGKCQYIDAYEAAGISEDGKKLPIAEKICLCHHISRYDTWTCGHTVTRLKETTTRGDNGIYVQPSTAEVIEDYLNM